MNIRNVQRTMRSYQGRHGFEAGSPGLEKSKLFGPGNGIYDYLETEPVCPAGGTYTWLEGEFPAPGVLMLRCSDPNHVPVSADDW